MSLEGWTHSFANFSNSLVLSNIFPCISLESAYLLWLHGCSNSLFIFNESGCMWACVVLRVRVCVWVCLSVSEISLPMDGQVESGGWCLSSSSVVLTFRDRLSHWTGRSLHWLSRKSLQISLSLPTNTGVTDVWPCSAWTWVSYLKCSCLWSIYLAFESLPPCFLMLDF